MEPLAPGMRRVGKMLRRQRMSSVSRLTPEQLEKAQSTAVPEVFASLLMGRRPSGVRTEDRAIDGVGIRIYTPAKQEPARRPVIVYFHGGGFVFGDLRGGDWMCGTVAHDLDAIVVAVDYRLAPRHPFPAAVDDCYAVTVWVSEHAAEIGADSDRLGVMGESAGGNLAAVVCLVAAERIAAGTPGPAIRHQALAYPVTGGGDTESRRANADAFILSLADMQRFDELYAGTPGDWRHEPLAALSHRGLPPALILVAGHDPLHDDGVLYADALSKDGVEARLVDYPAMPHGFLNFPRFARDARPALGEIVAAQRAALA